MIRSDEAPEFRWLRGLFRDWQPVSPMACRATRDGNPLILWVTFPRLLFTLWGCAAPNTSPLPSNVRLEPTLLATEGGTRPARQGAREWVTRSPSRGRLQLEVVRHWA
jgi:hypothetical protein